MNSQDFNSAARQHFGRVLAPFGFDSARSRSCVFYRNLGNDIYHVVMPDLGTRGAWYDVKIFATSTCFESNFDELFPDDIGIPSDVCCYLSDAGITSRQVTFNCKTIANFIARFQNTVEPLLTSIAIPYLNEISTFDGLAKHVRNPFHLAVANYYLQRENAEQELRTQLHRCIRLDSPKALPRARC